MSYQLEHGDCLEVMQQLETNSIDMVLCDLPYGTTACRWDTPIKLNALWNQYKRVCKENAAILLFAAHPFTAHLIMSNPQMFKYERIWIKNLSTNFLHAKRQPLRKHESVLTFYSKSGKYYPIKTTGHPPTQSAKGSSVGHLWTGENKRNYEGGETTRHPTTILPKFKVVDPKLRLHSTQKPVDLCEYLIKTHTLKGETVLDNCMGSGSTGIAALNLNRKFIGIEKEKEYFDMATERISKMRE